MFENLIEPEAPSIRTLWRELDALEADLRAQENAPSVGQYYIAQCATFNKRLIAVLTLARESMRGDHV